MTQTSIAPATDQQIDYTGIKPGEVRTMVVGPFTISMFHAAGGSFTRVDTRDAAGKPFPERSGNHVFESDALRAYVATCRWALATLD